MISARFLTYSGRLSVWNNLGRGAFLAPLDRGSRNRCHLQNSVCRAPPLAQLPSNASLVSRQNHNVALLLLFEMLTRTLTSTKFNWEGITYIDIFVNSFVQIYLKVYLQHPSPLQIWFGSRPFCWTPVFLAPLLNLSCMTLFESAQNGHFLALSHPTNSSPLFSLLLIRFYVTKVKFIDALICILLWFQLLNKPETSFLHR